MKTKVIPFHYRLLPTLWGQPTDLQVNKQAIKWLTEQGQKHRCHIGVVTVVGRYRTGKSYLLNRVLLGQNTGFEVGPTVNACTKGLWVWPQLIQSPHDEDLKLLVMDTEGLHSLEEGEKNDMKIFLMAMLLSSYFIYNSQGSIDEKAVQSLSLIVNLSKLLQKGASQQQMRDIVECFPSFMWLVRDFALRLEDESGHMITPKDYLENALRLQKGTSQATVKKNGVRKELLSFFRERDCFTLIRPIDDEKKLQDLARVKDTQLRPKFLQLVSQLRGKIMRTVRKKLFKGKPCSPNMFVEMCQHFCMSINTGGLPEIDSGWEMVCRAQSARVEQKCINEFYNLVADIELEVKSPADPSKLITHAVLVEKISIVTQEQLKYFDKNALGVNKEKRQALACKMQDESKRLEVMLSNRTNIVIDDALSDFQSQVQLMSEQSTATVFSLSDNFQAFLASVRPQTLAPSSQAHLYRKIYEAYKSCSFTLFGAQSSTKDSEQTLLSSKLNFYQSALNRLQAEQGKRVGEVQGREKQYRKRISELQEQARIATREAQRLKREFHSIKEDSQKENCPEEPMPVNAQ